MRYVGALTLFTCAPAFGALALYDGSLGTAPTAQGQLAYAQLPLTPSFTVTAAGKTSLNTTANQSIQAGYANYQPTGTLVNGAFPALDRAAGFGLQFDLRLLSETHSSTDRAGLSVTAISSDLRGIEIGFWTNSVWAQDDAALFTRAENAAYDTTVSRSYTLWIQGNTYTLSAGGSDILTGAVRDYTAWPKPPLAPYDPYELPSFIYLGDNTTSAAAEFEFSSLSVVPEPTALSLIALATTTLLRRRR